MRRFLGMLLMVIALSACGPSEIVSELGEYLEWSDSWTLRWDDAIGIADSTGRGNLSGPVAELQEIRRDARELDTIPEVERVHRHVVQAMDSAIEGFLAFMRQDADSMVDAHFSAYGSALDRWKAGLAELALEE